ncbi:MAG TPA: zeta toxin family protein [Flavobacterium sp.]|nr:zeta toxin family protein [Flavobacterium sp.]
MPALIIITGSNGAGKSSIGPEYIPDKLRDSIFDGDKLFMEKKSEIWASGIRSHKECRNRAFEMVVETFEKLVDDSIANNIDFVYEGHFTSEATWDIPKRFKSCGYKIHLIFFGLTNVVLSETRVIGRAHEGGHYVDPLTVQSNFYGNLKNLDKYYSLFDSVKIFDTSGIEHIELAELKNGIPYAAVPPKELPDWFTENLKAITTGIINAEESGVA